MYVQIFTSLKHLNFYEYTACISFINAEHYKILTASSVQLSLKLLKTRGTCWLFGISELESQKKIMLLAGIPASRKDVPFSYMGSLHHFPQLSSFSISPLPFHFLDSLFAHRTVVSHQQQGVVQCSMMWSISVFSFQWNGIIEGKSYFSSY